MNKNQNNGFETRLIGDPNCRNSSLFRSIATKIRKQRAARESAQREQEIREMENALADIFYP